MASLKIILFAVEVKTGKPCKLEKLVNSFLNSKSEFCGLVQFIDVLDEETDVPRGQKSHPGV